MHYKHGESHLKPNSQIIFFEILRHTKFVLSSSLVADSGCAYLDDISVIYQCSPKDRMKLY